MLKALYLLITMPWYVRKLEARIKKLEQDARFVEVQKWN